MSGLPLQALARAPPSLCVFFLFRKVWLEAELQVWTISWPISRSGSRCLRANQHAFPALYNLALLLTSMPDRNKVTYCSPIRTLSLFSLLSTSGERPLALIQPFLPPFPAVPATALICSLTPRMHIRATINLWALPAQVPVTSREPVRAGSA